MTKRSYTVWMAALALALVMPMSASADTLTYEFTGSLDGWTNIGGGSFGNGEGVFADTYYTQGISGDQTAILRSPTFQLDTSAGMAITAVGSGGAGNGALLPPNSLPATIAADGFLGIALWDVTTSSYVKSVAHSYSDPGARAYPDMGVSGLSSSHVYAIDFIDQSSAGYLMVTTINIPTLVPEPSSLVLLVCGIMGLLAYAWRKRR